MKIFKFIVWSLTLAALTALLVFGILKSIDYGAVCYDYWYLASVFVLSFILGMSLSWVANDKKGDRK